MTEVVMKAVALVETAETDNPNGAFDVILSAPTLDRDGEVIDSRAFDPLPDHIPFDVDHTMTVTGTVGSGTPYYDEAGMLRVKGTFASTPLGQEVRTLVAEGHIRTTSVTFMAAKRVTDDKGVAHVQTAELLNGTFTPVPSNREAVVLSAKALNAAVDEKVGARNSATDMEKIQAAHDAMTALGATCAAKSALPDGAKSIVGSLEATRDRVSDALEDAYPDRWTYIRGVLPTEVVFEAGPMNGGASSTYRQTYTDDGTVVILTGDPVEVDVAEIVVPDPDADREPDPLKSTDPATTEATAPAAADVAAKSADEDELRARLAVTENAARFAFL
jgi:HK97 family phage prohead protease